jgi:TnpA family transposase
LIAEATNLGLSRMAEVCGVASRRALLRMQTWHMREETFRAALASLTDAIHAEPLAAWFGSGIAHRPMGRLIISAVPAKPAERSTHYGRDPWSRSTPPSPIDTHRFTIRRSSPARQERRSMRSTASSATNQRGLTALHTDGGGVSDIVFAVMHLLGLDFEPRIPRLSDRQLYGFRARAALCRLAPLFGRRLGRDRSSVGPKLRRSSRRCATALSHRR